MCEGVEVRAGRGGRVEVGAGVRPWVVVFGEVAGTGWWPGEYLGGDFELAEWDGLCPD
jgi:hypothetical protein